MCVSHHHARSSGVRIAQAGEGRNVEDLGSGHWPVDVSEINSARLSHYAPQNLDSGGACLFVCVYDPNSQIRYHITSRVCVSAHMRMPWPVARLQI